MKYLPTCTRVFFVYITCACYFVWTCAILLFFLVKFRALSVPQYRRSDGSCCHRNGCVDALAILAFVHSKCRRHLCTCHTRQRACARSADFHSVAVRTWSLVATVILLNCPVLTESSYLSWLARFYTCPAESVGVTGGKSSLFDSVNSGDYSFPDIGVSADLGALFFGWADVELESNVGGAWLDDNSDGSGVDSLEVEGGDGVGWDCLEGEVLNFDELLAIHGVLDAEGGEGASSELLDVNCVESFKAGCLVSYVLTWALTFRWPSVCSFWAKGKRGAVETWAAVENFSISFGHDWHKIQFGIDSHWKNFFWGLFRALIFIIKEIHIDWVPAQFCYFSHAASSFLLIAIFASLAVSVWFLNFAACHVGHADSLFGEIVRSADSAETVGVDRTLRISELTFSIEVEEIESIAVDAQPWLIEVGAVLISVLASSSLVDSVSLNTGDAGSSVLVVLLAVLVWTLAEVLLVQGVSLLTAWASSILPVLCAMCNDAGFITGKAEGVFALVAAILVKPHAALDTASAVFEEEGVVARRADSFLVVFTAWFLFDAFLVLLGVVVAVHTLDAGTELIHLLAELIFGHTGAVWFEDVVRVALDTFSFVGNKAVWQFAGVVEKCVSLVAGFATSNEILKTAIDFAWLWLREVDEGSSTGGASSINIVAAPFLTWANAVLIQPVALIALEASIPLVFLETIGVDLDTFVVGVEFITRDTDFALEIVYLFTVG